MKRIVYWLLSTVTVLVLLFGYRTSLAGPLPTTTPATVAAAPSPTESSTGRRHAPSPARWPRPSGARSRSR
jgi:hypothetical protein